MNGYEYIRQLSRNSREAEEKAQRLEAAILEAEAIGDLTQLNKLADFEARTATTKGFAFKDIFELLDGQLPTMAGAMSFEYRVELCAYLGFLKKERGCLIEQAPSEWQGKRINQLTHKKKDIELLLSGETDKDVVNDTESQAATDSASAKSKTTTTPIGRNQKRLKIANEWYVALCNKLKNNRELVIEKINRLTNKEIKKELASITPVDEKHLWASGADRWIKDNGSTVWGFKKTQGGKTKAT